MCVKQSIYWLVQGTYCFCKDVGARLKLIWEFEDEISFISPGRNLANLKQAFHDWHKQPTRINWTTLSHIQVDKDNYKFLEYQDIFKFR